jgi:threonyl-tRNA synthetase
MKTLSPLEQLRHSAAHVLATAVLRLFPDALLDIGPPTASGFYYDFELDHKFTLQDLERIEGEMAKIIKENQVFECREVSRSAATNYFNEKKQCYKLERLNDVPEGSRITFYQNGEFIDLCAGTHINQTSEIKAFKLLSIAGAYYRGNEKNKQLQRIYGTAFPSQAELDTYLNNLEHAKQRDHRKLGKELDLFHIDDAVGQGLVLWMPNGAVIRHQLQAFIMEELNKQGYQQVFTPHIGKLDLYRTSGHFPYYQESQYPPLIDTEALEHLASSSCSCAELTHKLKEGDVEGYLLKPMNCPMHIKIFDSRPRSYKELPVRLAEFGTVYRWEQSGELNGMTRVRGMTQDDAHIFCTQDQVETEVHNCLNLVKTVLDALKITDYTVRLSLRDPNADKYTGDSQTWDQAEAALRKVVQTVDLPFTEGIGEAAFYGPKIDFLAKDVIGREWQLGTIQLDYNLPKRFNLQYTGSDNKQHMPVMIHRAPFGSMERFCGLLIEHFAGNFPVWLTPEQIRILPINDSLIEYAKQIEATCLKYGLRVTIDSASEKLGAKIRSAELAKVPYMLVVGNKELEAQTVGVRARLNKAHEGSMALEAFIQLVRQEIQSKA